MWFKKHKLTHYKNSFYYNDFFFWEKDVLFRVLISFRDESKSIFVHTTLLHYRIIVNIKVNFEYSIITVLL